MIDIGVNLADTAFDKDRIEIIKNAKALGVDTMIITGTSVAQSQKASQLAKETNLFSTAGIHPHDASSFDDSSMECLKELCLLDRTVAVGECGLDFYRTLSPKEKQIDVLRYQLDLAVELELPVFLHERDALEETISILKEFGTSLPKTVIHCFTGNQAALDRYLEMGLWVGITGWVCDERRGSELQQCIHSIPNDRLMIETDAPYLLPRTIRPKPKNRRNEPKHLIYVAEQCATLRDVPLTNLKNQTQQNAIDFFGLNDFLQPMP